MASNWNFVRVFREYVASRTDAPADYHIHAALATLSVALGTRVWIEGRGKDLYPNLWIVNIGRSGIGKSVPLDISQRVLELAGLGHHKLDDSFSHEALYDIFKSQPVRIAYIQEFASFMGMLNREYNQGLRDWLTDIHDTPAVFRRTLRGQSIELVRPFLTILGATAPGWFADQFKMAALNMGFLARFIYCPSSDRGEYVAHPGPFRRDIETALAGHLRQLTLLEGRADYSGVAELYNAWDRQNREELLRTPDELAGLRARDGTKVLKAALLFHVARKADLAVEEEDLANAVTYVERSDEQAARFLTEEVAHDKDDADRLAILRIVALAGGAVPWSKALKDSHMSSERLARATKTLVETEQLVIGSVSGSRGKWLQHPSGTNGTHPSD